MIVIMKLQIRIVNFEKYQESEKGWEVILKIPTELPSNSLCIIDRFLFAEDGKYIGPVK